MFKLVTRQTLTVDNNLNQPFENLFGNNPDTFVSAIRIKYEKMANQ
jgi:hypothetical protein